MNTAKVMATFDNNGKEVPSDEPLPLTPTEADAYGIKRVVAWTLVKDNACADWTKKVDKVPSGEYGYTIATLLEDTRGNYFTTHAGSAGDNKYKDENGVLHNVYYTEDEYRAFWIYGYRVEYRAMQADNMLVEDYGDVASYEEGDARFALYLYNQFETAEKEFQRELYSQVIEVCHPMQMTNMTATTAVSILTNTEYDEEDEKQVDADEDLDAVNPGVSTQASNAYYSLYSTGAIVVNLLDGLHNCAAKEEHASEAEFELTLITAGANDALKALIEEFELELNDDLNDDDKVKVNNVDVDTYATRKIAIEANQFVDCEKSQIKFRITEKVTGKSQTVTITLKTPELEEDPEGEMSAKVATIEEYSDILKTKLAFEKFSLKVNGTSSILLEQKDKYGNTIGVDNNLHVANTANPTHAYMIVDGGAVLEDDGTVTMDDCVLDAGDRVLIITGPDGKIFPYAADTATDTYGYGWYKNPNYTTKVPTGYEMPEYTDGLYADVVEKTGYATSADGTSVNVNQYEFAFAAGEDLGTGLGAEAVFAKAGRYNITIKTIKAIDATTGEIEYTKSTGVTSTLTFNVSDPRTTVSYTRRDLTRITADEVEKYDLRSDTIGDYDWAGTLSADHATTGATKNKEYGDSDDVKELILAAFDFSLGAEEWVDNHDGTYTLTNGTSKLSTEDILYYTYTYTGTNKQVVINTVTFKVGTGNGFYRATATVNKSLTFDFE